MNMKTVIVVIKMVSWGDLINSYVTYDQFMGI